jgi:hypothetical protein
VYVRFCPAEPNYLFIDRSSDGKFIQAEIWHWFEGRRIKPPRAAQDFFSKARDGGRCQFVPHTTLLVCRDGYDGVLVLDVAMPDQFQLHSLSDLRVDELVGWNDFRPYNHQFCFISDSKYSLIRRSKGLNADSKAVWHMQNFKLLSAYAQDDKPLSLQQTVVRSAYPLSSCVLGIDEDHIVSIEFNESSRQLEVYTPPHLTKSPTGGPQIIRIDTQTDVDMQLHTFPAKSWYLDDFKTQTRYALFRDEVSNSTHIIDLTSGDELAVLPPSWIVFIAESNKCYLIEQKVDERIHHLVLWRIDGNLKGAKKHKGPE